MNKELPGSEFYRVSITHKKPERYQRTYYFKTLSVAKEVIDKAKDDGAKTEIKHVAIKNLPPGFYGECLTWEQIRKETRTSLSIEHIDDPEIEK